jgi:hypothetical protein
VYTFNFLFYLSGLKNWQEEMKQHKKERRALRAAEKAKEEAAKAAGNSTVPTSSAASKH